MALKAIVDRLDSVEEAYRSLYEEKDGKFVLAVEGIESHPGAAALKSALDRVRGEKRTLSEKLTTAESRLEGLPDDFDADAYETLKHQAEGKEPTNVDQRLTAQMRGVFASSGMAGNVLSVEPPFDLMPGMIWLRVHSSAFLSLELT